VPFLAADASSCITSQVGASRWTCKRSSIAQASGGLVRESWARDEKQPAWVPDGNFRRKEDPFHISASRRDKPGSRQSLGIDEPLQVFTLPALPQ
jgi:hypothetical protein